MARTTYRIEKRGAWYRWTTGDVASLPTFSSQAAALDDATSHGYRSGYCKPTLARDGLSLSMVKA